MPSDKIHQLTCVGAILYILGVFLPIASFPVVGDISYYSIDNMSGMITVALAIAAIALIVIKQEKITAVAAIGVWVVLLWPILKNMGGGSDDSGGGMLGDLVDSATDPMADLAGELFSHIDVLSLGGIAFVVGLLVLTIGAIMTSLKALK